MTDTEYIANLEVLLFKARRHLKKILNGNSGERELNSIVNTVKSIDNLLDLIHDT